MSKFSATQIEEINVIIKAIEAALAPGLEIGTRDRAILTGLLQANKIDKTPKFFKCKREYSDTILTYFTKEKGLTRNKFSTNSQTAVFLL